MLSLIGSGGSAGFNEPAKRAERMRQVMNRADVERQASAVRSPSPPTPLPPGHPRKYTRNQISYQFMLLLGTMFARVEDRDVPGEGFTHKMGDVVDISNARLGTLRNPVQRSTECPEWTFGITALLRNLAAREFL